MPPKKRTHRKKVKRAIKNRSKQVVFSDKKASIAKWTFRWTGFLITSLLVLEFSKRSKIPEDLLVPYSITLLFIIAYFLLFATSMYYASKSTQSSQLAWKYGLRFRLLMMLSLCFFIVFLYLCSFIGIFQRFPEIELIQNLLFFVLLSGILSIAVILFVAYNPRFIVSKWITGFGSLMYVICTLGLAVIVVLSCNVFLKIFDVPLKWIITVVVSVILYFRLGRNQIDAFFSILNPKRLNTVQLNVVQFGKPDKLLAAIRSFAERLNDKKKALRILRKLDRNESLGVKIEVLNILNDEGGHRRSLIWIIVSGLVLWVLSSIGEGLIQDLVNDDIKEMFCRAMDVLCAPRK
jgi:hypothetical protein